MTAAPVLDPVFATVADVLFAGTVDPTELAKALDGTDVHVDQLGKPKSKKKLLATGLLAGAGIEALAAKDTLEPFAAAARAVRPTYQAAEGLAAKAKALKPLAGATKPVTLRSPSPVKLGAGTKLGLQGGNFAVGLGAARELGRKPKKPGASSVSKADRRSEAAAATGAGAAVQGVRAGRARVVQVRRFRDAKQSAAAYDRLDRVRSSVHYKADPIKQPVEHAREMNQARGMGRAMGSEHARLSSAADDIRRAGRAVRSRGAGAVALGVTAAALGTRRHGQVSKAVSLIPVNPLDVKHTVSLKARKPAGSPPVKVAPGPMRPVRALVASGQISKMNEERHQVFGWANISSVNGRPVVDRQDDVIPIEELEKGAYTYVIESRIGGDQHQRAPLVKAAGAPVHTADLIESMVFTDEKCEALGLPADFPRGWWIGMHVRDEDTWTKIKSGERTGFSVHGTGIREDMPQLELLGLGGVPDYVPDDWTDEFVPFGIGKRAYGGVLDKGLRERVDAAKNPPPPKMTPVRSSAVSSMGYQRQTRRLGVAFKSDPDKEYSYRASPRTARAAAKAPSKGKFVAGHLRGKAKDGRPLRLIDRARLFANPPKRDAS